MTGNNAITHANPKMIFEAYELTIIHEIVEYVDHESLFLDKPSIK